MARLGRARPIGSIRHGPHDTVVPSATWASDDFNRTENPLSQGGKWIADFDSPAEANGTHFVSTAFASEGAYRADLGICADASVHAVLGSTITENYLWVRRDPGANNGYCLIAIGGTTMEVYRVTGGSFVRLGAAITQAHVAGDVIALTIEGTLLTVSLNGAYVGERTDANFASGYVAISSYNGGTFNSFWAMDLDVNPIQAPVAIGTMFDPSSTSPYSLTTTGAVPAGARIFVRVSWIQFGSGFPGVITVSGGSLTWAADHVESIIQGDNTNNFAIWSAECPSGLASSTALSIALTAGSGGTRWGIGAAAFHCSGVAVSSRTDGATEQLQNGATSAWDAVALATTNAEDLLLASALGDGIESAGSTIDSPWVELADWYDSDNDWGHMLGYRIVSSTGTYGAGGDWPDTPIFGGVSNIAAYKAFKPPVAGGGDTTSPIITVLSGPTLTKISQVSGKDSFQFVWESDEAFTAHEVRSVPAAGSDHTAGTLIESGGGAAAGADVTSTITDDEVVAADPGDEAKIVKVFVQDAAGNWSI